MIKNGRRGSPSYFRRTQGSKRRREMRTRLAEAQNWRCAYCGAALEPGTVTTDHVVSLARGGPNHWANMVASCRPCNVAKAFKAI